jgi:multidrug efflux pump subunit AcrA (membrane-fusion protein)
MRPLHCAEPLEVTEAMVQFSRMRLLVNVPGLLPGAMALSLLMHTACSTGSARQPKAGAPSEKEATVPVKVFTVQSSETRRSVEAVGSLFAYDEVVVSAEVDGRAEKVLVDVGDQVTKGETLVEILPTEFKLAADQQEAMLEQAKAKLGLTGSEADLQDPAQAASVKKAAADLANASQRYERSKKLAEQGLVPRQTFDEDEANYKAVQAAYDLAVQDVRNLQAALQQARVMRDLANKKLRDTNVLAPFGGYVKERNVTLGQYLKDRECGSHSRAPEGARENGRMGADRPDVDPVSGGIPGSYLQRKNLAHQSDGGSADPDL